MTMDDTNKLSEEAERERFETCIKSYPELLGRNRAGTQGYYDARTYWAWRGWCSAKASTPSVQPPRALPGEASERIERAIAAALRPHGLTLMKTAAGYEVARLGELKAEGEWLGKGVVYGPQPGGQLGRDFPPAGGLTECDMGDSYE